MIVLLDQELARTVVEEGIRRYFADRRERVTAFVDRHFSLPGTLALHRAALGWDIARAPLNLVLAGPQFGLQTAGRMTKLARATRLASWLERRDILLRTRVAREIEWLVATELLELPWRQDDRVATRDALTETILSDPRLTEALHPVLTAIGQRANEPEFRQQLQETVGHYAGARGAASEITTSLLTLGTGALALKQLTPGVATLGPALASVLAQQMAIASFPLGTGLGGLWYGLFPAAPSIGLVAGLTGGMALAASALAAFAGIIADPVQRHLGLHRKRLLRLIDTIERQASDPTSSTFAVRDHYVARLVDLFDLLGAAYRLAR